MDRWRGGGPAADIEIQAREILNLRKRLNDILVEQTGQSSDVIERAVERDKFMTADEAKTFGLIDHVTISRDPPDKDARPQLAAEHLQDLARL